MKVVLASDHAGFKIKEKVKNYLMDKNIEVLDVGAFSEESVDYPVFAFKAGEAINQHKADYAIIFCGTGEGISIAINKVKGIRCGVAYDDEVTRLLREHNNANAVAFGARFMKEEDILRRIDIFLNTEFLGGRHQKRLDLISDYEK